jgi:hypothetical protein
MVMQPQEKRHMHDHPALIDQQLVFNGIDGHTGEYLLPPTGPAEIARMVLAQWQGFESAELDDFAARIRQEKSHTRGPAAGIDPDDLAQTGWAVVRPQVEPHSEAEWRQAAIIEALGPLLDLRCAQSSQRFDHYYRECVYRPGETKRQFLGRLGVEPGPAHPERLPYYLLLVGSPEEIPFSVQYQLDVQYAVGRLHFEDIEDYAHYARSVVEAERGSANRSRRAVYFGVENANDPATERSRRYLVEPLVARARAMHADWDVQSVLGEEATKARLGALLGDDPPALLFTASHGLRIAPENPYLHARQGALLCQDWPGPGARPVPSMYFAGEDVPRSADLRGMISFHVACYGAGTPRQDEFWRWRSEPPRPLAPSPFVARLPQRLLGNPGGGALAVIGHVDRAFSSSFVLEHPENPSWKLPSIAAFESALDSLMAGHRLGYAMEFFGMRYAESASDLTECQQAIEIYRERLCPKTLAQLWLETTDARNYSVLGDPAVQFPATRPSGE